MLSANDTGQADVLNCIVTTTDLFSAINDSVETLSKLAEAIARLKGILSSKPDVAESFAESGGYECLLKALETISTRDNWTNGEIHADEDTVVPSTSTSDLDDSEDEKAQLQKELLQLTFSALSQALASSLKSRDLFMQIDGYGQVETILRSSHIISHTSLRDYVFGTLFGAAINDFSHCHVFSSMRWHLNSDDLSDKERFDRISFKMQAAFEFTERLPNPSFISVILNLLPDIKSDEDLGLAICDALQIIVNANRSNQLAFFNSTAFNEMIENVVLGPSKWTEENLTQSQIELLEDLIFSISALGLPHHLASSAVSTAVQRTGGGSESSLLPVLQQYATQSRLPPHLHFDMQPHGNAALTFLSLTPPFPPISTPGYTLSMWLRIEKFDPEMHLTLFGAFDTSQKCFCMAYIEQDTHKLVLQTSLRSSVRFKSFEFTQGRWYHIVITHRRPRTTTSARAFLFVDGALADQVKCSYPLSVPGKSIQAFFGTPPTFASHNTKPILQWSLSQAHLWADLLPEDLIEIIFQLGPRYHGNFQDSLGQFQTYDASTALNIRLASMGGAKAEKSILMAAIRGKGGTFAPESKLLLSVSPLAMLDRGDVRFLLNCGVPRVADALALENGTGTTIGSVVPVIPRSLDDMTWNLGGCAIGLRIVEKASTSEELLRAVKVLFEVIRLSWRNSEDMERCHGYEILAHLLKGKKREMIHLDLLRVITEFIGVDLEDQRYIFVLFD
jgi:beige protein homolog 1